MPGSSPAGWLATCLSERWVRLSDKGPSQSRHYEDLPEGDGVVVRSRQQTILSAPLQAERLLRRRPDPGHLLRPEEVFTVSSLFHL